MREKIYLDRLQELIQNYHFDLPLSIFLRQEFNKRRNMGSRDRKRTREDIFNYFRIGINLPELSIPERVAVGSFLCGTSRSPELDFILSRYSPFLPEQLPLDIESKLETILNEYPYFDLEKIFPFSNHLSGQIDKEKFLLSFLSQPRLWIRMRKEFREEVLLELKEKEITYQISEFSPLTLSFSNSTPVHELAAFSKGAFEVQDLNSQRCAHYFPVHAGESWWDACAGSGGKSLLLLDREPGLLLTATDRRETSLQNLRLRMKKAGLHIADMQQMDLSKEASFSPESFDGILADVPCSGSGTWARTPEMLSAFSIKNLMEKFIPLQRKVIQNLTHALKIKRNLIYITCSVFQSENEGNIEYFEKYFGLKCVSSRYFEGAGLGADTLFVAILEKEGTK